MILTELIRLAENIWALMVKIWETGNRWARWAIVLIVGWPFLLLVIAMTGSGILISLVSLILVLIIFLSLMVWVSPGALAVIAIFKSGRTTLRAFATIIGMELVLGIYCALVPIQENRALAIVVLLIFWAIVFLSIGLKTKRSLVAIGFLTLLLIALTASFFFSGITKAAKVAMKRTNDRIEEKVQKGEGFFSAVSNELPQRKDKIGNAETGKHRRQIQEGYFELEPGEKEVTGMTAEARDLIEYYQLSGASFFSDGWREEITEEKKVLNSDGPGTIILTNRNTKNRIKVRIIPYYN